MDKQNIPFFMDFAVELPPEIEIESKFQARDSVTWTGTTVIGCDDD